MTRPICPKCNPALAAVYQSKGDWCHEHGFPGSLCPICKPDVKLPDVGPPVAAPADWCGGHGLPESKCTKCNPSLVAQFKAAGDWCEEHGFPDSVCPICNPQTPPTSAAAGDWCVEHGLPESKCTKCNPSLVQEYRAAGDYCDAHGFPESVCPVCKPVKPPAGAEEAALEARTVRFKSPDIEAAAGIATVMVQRVEAATSSVACTARLAFHGDRVAEIHAVVPGIVRKVRVELGDRVEAGGDLFELQSIHVGEIQAELQTAREGIRTAQANLERKRELLASEITSRRQVDLAEQELITAQAHANAAQAGLRLLGAGKASASGRYVLVAPLAGTVVRRPAVLGILATEEISLATIADTSVMWALCDVPETAASDIALGQTLQLSIDADTASSFEGEITWIAAEVDPRTRTVTAQAEMPNPGGKLRANQFGLARIDTSAAKSAVSVPREAVQRVGKLDVVFVRTGPGVYEPRVVKRSGDGEVVAVKGRLRSGEAVVTTGAVLLRTEIMPGSIGAGCCEVEPPGGR
ncbi:efflux RND transporter periplasmic adaptor subunit [Nannocystis bainbridge]|uniref:Efflux RND transporter periplasmic adaptor subunit n=1 Tax=Nannocystis bainbridge TaxID=2995303 RepID=A0ABT5E6H4_9BACT|nr:efflux RND transporter periplasmic adaptor subunit [Nannocystis bainbridge]MDC0721467.1 efflux RND transporter periplasmic adaptor subunit [Nannocystis bainbridge]